MSAIEVAELLGDYATAAVVIGLAAEYLPNLFAWWEKPWYERERFGPILPGRLFV
jgi:hypothetical protein